MPYLYLQTTVPKSHTRTLVKGNLNYKNQSLSAAVIQINVFKDIMRLCRQASACISAIVFNMIYCYSSICTQHRHQLTQLALL